MNQGGMRQSLLRVGLALTVLLTGCGTSGGSGTLEVTENGIYDVSGYSEVVVNVIPEEGIDAEVSEDGQPAIPESLDLVRIKVRDFSMEVPDVMVEGYTEAELTENDIVSLRDPRINPSTQVASLSIHRSETFGSVMSLEDFSDAPQEQVGDLVMAIRHEHASSWRTVEAQFIRDNCRYTVTLSFSLDLDGLYGDYSEEFYRTIQF